MKTKCLVCGGKGLIYSSTKLVICSVCKGEGKY